MRVEVAARTPRSTASGRLVGGAPDRFALVDVIGPPKARASAQATGWAGTRTATVPPPPARRSASPGHAGTITVSGPGQKRSPRRRTTGVKRPGAALDLVEIRRNQRDRLVDLPAFDAIELLDRALAGRVGRQAVQRVRRVRQHDALAQQVRRAGNDVRRRGGRRRRQAKSRIRIVLYAILLLGSPAGRALRCADPGRRSRYRPRGGARSGAGPRLRRRGGASRPRRCRSGRACPLPASCCRSRSSRSSRPAFWHHHYKKVAVAWALVFFAPFLVAVRDTRGVQGPRGAAGRLRAVPDSALGPLHGLRRHPAAGDARRHALDERRLPRRRTASSPR